MRWFALALIVLNLGVWQLSASSKSEAQAGATASGTLPRVFNLKLQGVAKAGHRSVAKGLGCVRLGWIRSLDTALALKTNPNLAPISGVSVEEVDRPLPPLHWVIIPPQPLSAAVEQLRRMQDQGIDSYLVTEGVNTNAISLGLFESRDAAKSVLKKNKRKNFNVVLVNFDRNQISYALAFEAELNLVQGIAQALEADYGSEFDFIEINRCKGVASSEKNP